MTDFAAARLNMVESQLRPNRVLDQRLVLALGALPRERFVPKALRGVAYVDEDLPIGRGRYLLEPLILARLLEAAEVRPTDAAMEIGSGTGYGTAVLGRLAGSVVGIEEDAELAAQAGDALSELGIDTAIVVPGTMAGGYPRQAPYDVILISGAVAEVPAVLFEQLGEDGRLVGVEWRPGEVGHGVAYRRIGGAISRRVLFDAACPYLPGFAPQPAFRF